MHDFTVHEKLRGIVPASRLPDMYLPMEEGWKDAHDKDGKRDSDDAKLVNEYKRLQAQHYQDHQGRRHQPLRDEIYKILSKKEEPSLDTPLQVGDLYHFLMTPVGMKRSQYRCLPIEQVPSFGLTVSEWYTKSLLVLDENKWDEHITLDGTLMSPKHTYFAYRTEKNRGEFTGKLTVRHMPRKTAAASDMCTFNCNVRPGAFAWEPTENGLFIANNPPDGDQPFAIDFHFLHDHHASPEIVRLKTEGLETIDRTLKPYTSLWLLGNRWLVISCVQNHAARRPGFQTLYVAELWDERATPASIKAHLHTKMKFRQYTHTRKAPSELPEHLTLLGFFNGHLYFSTITRVPMPTRLFAIDLSKPTLMPVPLLAQVQMDQLSGKHSFARLLVEGKVARIVFCCYDKSYLQQEFFVFDLATTELHPLGGSFRGRFSVAGFNDEGSVISQLPYNFQSWTEAPQSYVLKWNAEGRHVSLPLVKETHRQEHPHLLCRTFEYQGDTVNGQPGPKIPTMVMWHKEYVLSAMIGIVHIAPSEPPNAPTHIITYGANGQIPDLLLDHCKELCELVTRTRCRVAYCAVRGGGEKLEKWREAGVLHNEHNAIADILAASAFFRGQNVDSKQLVPDKAAAQHLSPHPNGFSSSVSLCSYSAGAHLGMLAVNLKPDAFEAVVLRAGVYDMVRLHHYGAKNTTRSWVTQHGDITLEAHRAWIPALNPLTTVKQHEGREAGYKAILLDVSENDGTVHALHSFKQTAELQLKNKANAEAFLMLVRPDGYHAVGSEEWRHRCFADQFAFILPHLGLGEEHLWN